MKRSIAVVHVLLVLACMGTSCAFPGPLRSGVQPPQGEPEYGLNLVPLDADSVLGVTQTAALVSPGTPGPAVALKVVPGSTTLRVVTTGDGYVRTYDLHGVEPTNEHSLGIVTPTGASFDHMGDTVIGARAVELWDSGFGLTEYIGDIAIWNALTGSQVACADLLCFEGARWKPSALGVAMDPMGRRYIGYSELAYGVHDFLGGSTSTVVSETQAGSSPERVIARIAFDADGDRIAIAYSDGRIEIKGGFPILGLHGDDSGENLPTSALMFSPNGRYLARIQGPDVSLWRLGFLCGRLRLVEDAGGGHLLAFTGQTGLLLVGGADQVRVWSAETGALVGRIETQGITSLTVSTDDRLIVWGDTEGGIHVLAATH